MSCDLDIAKCFDFATELVLQAGKILKSGEDEQIIYKKNKEDFVTNYDQQIEKLFIDGLAKEFPDHRIIAEETVFTMQKMPELTDAPTWFLDPIDGTINFMHSLPYFCISIALMVRKEFVLGIIYNPSNSEFYSAIKGKGAFLNGKPIHVSNITDLKQAMIGSDVSIIKYVKKDKDIYTAKLIALIEATQTIRCIGSAALSMAYLARGIIDVLHADGVLKPWDIAAGTLLIREAGGTVIDSKGGIYDIMKANITAAANESLTREIFKINIDTDLKRKEKDSKNLTQGNK
ncbi:PREDICTED: inositol monophosphatase 2-like [Trachymyrmex cornetzi]|uniref:Inositol-1-monophosphatase n=1 Tax=Trachymyrmex cornetzi TaxID=471704 RepID=A0A195DHU0_9HYME|nr:PREDICTED: inositol monophosphatase 2-like [Trachymyrmex cornetzi]KYN12468.1 Inositol monophosphatase 2 [Trachymyrmex cornetzi]